MVEGARSEHGDDRAGEDGRRDLGTCSGGSESEDDAERDRYVEGPFVEDTPKTWFQLTGSGRSHDGTVLTSADLVPEGVSERWYRENHPEAMEVAPGG